LSVDDSASEQTISVSTPSPEELVNAFNKANIQAMNDLTKKLAVDLRN
jgi:hypothetical protein